jgi:hypothetical protein
LTELLVMNAPMAAPRMMTISEGCQSKSRLPPAIRNPMTTERITTTEPTSAIIEVDSRVDRVVGGCR